MYHPPPLTPLTPPPPSPPQRGTVWQSVEQLAELVQVQASLCGGFSVICCPSRRITHGAHGAPRTRRAGAAGGPAYTTLEMGGRRVVEEEDEGVGPGV